MSFTLDKVHENTEQRYLFAPTNTDAQTILETTITVSHLLFLFSHLSMFSLIHIYSYIYAYVHIFSARRALWAFRLRASMCACVFVCVFLSLFLRIDHFPFMRLCLPPFQWSRRRRFFVQKIFIPHRVRRCVDENSLFTFENLKTFLNHFVCLKHANVVSLGHTANFYFRMKYWFYSSSIIFIYSLMLLSNAKFSFGHYSLQRLKKRFSTNFSPIFASTNTDAEPANTDMN